MNSYMHHSTKRQFGESVFRRSVDIGVPDILLEYGLEYQHHFSILLKARFLNFDGWIAVFVLQIRVSLLHRLCSKQNA